MKDILQDKIQKLNLTSNNQPSHAVSGLKGTTTVCYQFVVKKIMSTLFQALQGSYLFIFEASYQEWFSNEMPSHSNNFTICSFFMLNISTQACTKFSDNYSVSHTVSECLKFKHKSHTLKETQSYTLQHPLHAFLYFPD